MLRRCALATIIATSGFVFPIQANPSTPTDASSKQLLEKQQALLRQYKAIAEDLLSLAHRLEKSTRVEDQEKAKLIRKAIELGDKEGIENKFQAILRTFAGKNGMLGLSDVSSARNQNDELVRALKQIQAILTSDDSLEMNKAEQARLEKFLAELRAILRSTKINRVLTESEKSAKEKIAKEQSEAARKTEGLGERMDAQKSPGAGHVKQAAPDQGEAVERIRQEQRPQAVAKQTQAIDKLHLAEQELLKRLKQLREEELERLLANLEARVAQMLQMQIEVRSATVAIDAIVQKNESRKPQKAEIQKSQAQSDKEGEIIALAKQTIELLKSEGSAVAFPRIFEETAIDMVRVQERLQLACTDENTQFLEQQIIDALREMHEALKRAQAGLNNPPGPPTPPNPGDKPPEQKLLEEIAELKMLRNLQVRVNQRTERQGMGRTGEEQSTDPLVKNELKDLASRQTKIEEMTRDIAMQRNK
jgi:hypothetical protein